jgi:large exoprotein involved in heme utilization and adhesion
LLTINIPIGLNFRDDPGIIVNQSSATDSNGNITGLQVSNGESLLLVGGDINLDGGGLSAPGGRIELGGQKKSRNC